VNPNILLVKVDSTVNDAQGVAIQGFPTLKFYKKDKKAAPIDFKEDRTVEGIINFIKKNTKYDWIPIHITTSLLFDDDAFRLIFQ